MSIHTFKDLQVYQRSYAVSLEMHRISLEMPREEQYGLASQLRQASKSICANLAEGFAKQSFSKIEFKRYIKIALGSASEMLVWLDYCKDLEYISEAQHETLYTEYEEIAKMLNALGKNWK